MKIGDLKAISLNLMHGNLSITDEIYAILSGDDAQRRAGWRNWARRRAGT